MRQEFSLPRPGAVLGQGGDEILVLGGGAAARVFVTDLKRVSSQLDLSASWRSSSS